MLEVVDGLEAFCQRKGIAKVSDLIGAVRDTDMNVDKLEALP
jgi:dihydroorotate dehydrogenase (NAD+) catalytic subunit